MIPRANWTLTSTRVAGLERKTRATLKRSADLRVEYQQAAAEVRDEWNDKSRAWAGSGKPGMQSGLYRVQYNTSLAGSGRFYIRVGWMRPAPPRSVGNPKVPYYRYWDAGFNLFGDPNRHVEGIGAYLDARADLRQRIVDINQRFARDFAREFRL